MIYNPPNLKDKNVMGRLIDIQAIKKEKIEDYFEDFSYNLEEIREYYNNFKLGIEFINNNNNNNNNKMMKVIKNFI